MKIRRQFKVRKFKLGGGNCPEGKIWDDVRQTCVDKNEMAFGVKTPTFGGDLSSKFQLPADLQAKVDANPTFDFGNNQSLGPNEIMLSPADLGIESNADKLKRIEEEADLSQIESDTADINAFTQQLDAQNKADAANESAAFDEMIQNQYENDLGNEFDNLDPIKNQEETRLFNPYAGVDIPTAAYLAGKNWAKGGNKTTAVAATGKFLLGSARNFFSGMGMGNREAQQLKAYNENMARSKRTEFVGLKEGGLVKQDIEDLLDGIPINIMEDGGEVDIDLLTGSYAKGTNNGDENVELEDGEYLQEPEGTPKKVEGKTHEESDENGTGEKMNLPGGTEVISNSLKPNRTQRKELAKAYGLKIKASDTYANVLEKFNKSIGLTELIEEEEEIIEEIKKQKERMAEEGADEATSNINLEFLSSKLKDIGDEKIGLEDLSKKTFDELFRLQEDSKPSSEKDMDQKEFNIGGKIYNQDQIIGIANKFGVDKDRALSIVKKMEGGGPVEDRREVLIAQARGLGYEGDLSPENIEKNIGEIQKFLAKKNPQAIIDYFKGPDGIAITAKGLDIIKSKNPEIFKELNFDVNKPSASFTEDERKAIQQKAQEAGAVDDAFFLDQFQDGRWEYRFPLLPVDAPKAGIQMKDIKIPDLTVDDLRLKTYEKEKEIQNDLVDPDKQIKEKVKRGPSGEIMLLPENLPLPPQGLQLPAMFTRRYGRIDLQAVSPDQKLAEVDRVFAAAEEQIQQLPSGQREAAILKLAANKANKQDEIINAYNVQQNQLNQSEEAFNIRQGDREEDARVLDTSRYQEQASMAMANTEDDFRRFFNTVQERNIQNFNTINSLNLLNQASDNFNFGNRGVEFTGGADTTLEDLLKEAQFNEAVRRSNPVPQEETKKKKKSTARRGGRIKRKY